MLRGPMRWAKYSATAIGETARKASRRRAQIAKLREEQRRERHLSVNPQTGSSDEAEGHAVARPRAQRDGHPPDGGVATQWQDAQGLTLEANRAYERVLLGKAKESTLQRQAALAIRRAPTKAAAMDAFSLLAHSGSDGGGGVSAGALRAVATALVTHHAKAQMGPEAFAVALKDAVGSSEERWSDVNQEELRAFALYQCLRLERHAEKGHAFSDAAGMTLEGSDNDAVALVEFQIHRYTKEVAPVSTDVYADLMHLDISWNAALRLYDAVQAQRGVEPPVELSNRLMSLMTGYRSNGIGSRPWQQALALYDGVIHSGYETTLRTHTLALDALWRSADSFHKQQAQRHVSEADQERIWREVVRVRNHVEEAGLANRIAGEEGCAYYESLVKAVCAAGKTEVALRLVEEMDAQPEDTSFRLLVPTAETYAFAMAACNTAGNAAHAESLRTLMQQHYSLSDLHSEVLLVYLQSLRNVTRTNATIGAQLVELLHPRGGGGAHPLRLDRPCAVACLQLLATRSVQPPATAAVGKGELAIQLYDMYDASIWLQEPVARKVELQTVFRCCYLIALQLSSAAGETAASSKLMRHVKSKLRSVFGAASPELEWLADTEVYGLEEVTIWQHAVDIYSRQVLLRPPERVKYLPVPLRQVREAFVAALLRCCLVAAGATGALHAADDGVPTRGGRRLTDGDDGADDTFLFLEEGTQQAERGKARDMAQRSLALVERTVYPEAPVAATPCSDVAQLLLVQALCVESSEERRALGVRAMKRLSLCDASSISPRAADMVARVLGLTEEYVESVLGEGHASLRGRTLAELHAESSRLHRRAHPLERMFV